MKNTLKVDFEKKLIVMDRTFAKLCQNVKSDEYGILQTTRKDYPDFAVVRKQIKKNSAKESYKGLTYDYMREYISTHESADRASLMLEKLENMIAITHCHSQAYRYPVIKRWFLETYPDVKSFGIDETVSFEETPIDDVA